MTAISSLLFFFAMKDLSLGPSMYSFVQLPAAVFGQSRRPVFTGCGLPR